ncbi:MAG: hypothetical protein AB7J30_18120, partial [Hyphomicrobium sp.]
MLISRLGDIRGIWAMGRILSAAADERQMKGAVFAFPQGSLAPLYGEFCTGRRRPLTSPRPVLNPGVRTPRRGARSTRGPAQSGRTPIRRFIRRTFVMRHFDLTPLYRSTVGFDRFAQLL